MFWLVQNPKSGACENSPVCPILQRLPFYNTTNLYWLGIYRNCSYPPSIFMAIFLRISSHKPAVFFLRSLSCLLDMRLGIGDLYSCNLYLNSHFSLSMLSVPAVKDKNITSKSENLGNGPRRGILLCSLTRFLEYYLHISSIFTNFV